MASLAEGLKRVRLKFQLRFQLRPDLDRSPSNESRRLYEKSDIRSKKMSIRWTKRHARFSSRSIGTLIVSFVATRFIYRTSRPFSRPTEKTRRIQTFRKQKERRWYITSKTRPVADQLMLNATCRYWDIAVRHVSENERHIAPRWRHASSTKQSINPYFRHIEAEIASEIVLVKRPEAFQVNGVLRRRLPEN